mmetsp:Transcript_86135/g.149072  ORF Transcript_86135/g.149072 Transcript_86135/m.149072 type:complete len:231 (-) Transcript_86135:7-699(-)
MTIRVSLKTSSIFSRKASSTFARHRCDSMASMRATSSARRSALISVIIALTLPLNSTRSSSRTSVRRRILSSLVAAVPALFAKAVKVSGEEAGAAGEAVATLLALRCMIRLRRSSTSAVRTCFSFSSKRAMSSMRAFVAAGTLAPVLIFARSSLLIETSPASGSRLCISSRLASRCLLSAAISSVSSRKRPLVSFVVWALLAAAPQASVMLARNSSTAALRASCSASKAL